MKNVIGFVATSITALSAVAAIAGCGAGTTDRSSAAPSPATATDATSTVTAPGKPSEPTRTAVITTKRDNLGTILAFGPQKLTVYLFAADRGGASTCTGGCARDWPPVIGTARASGEAVGSNLGTIRRPDGTRQITYNGHPLYLFASDKDNGDIKGQAIVDWGAEWYVISPSGAEIEKSAGNKSDES